jgi:hypothetical protein
MDTQNKQLFCRPAATFLCEARGFGDIREPGSGLWHQNYRTETAIASYMSSVCFGAHGTLWLLNGGKFSLLVRLPTKGEFFATKLAGSCD